MDTLYSWLQRQSIQLYTPLHTLHDSSYSLKNATSMSLSQIVHNLLVSGHLHVSQLHLLHLGYEDIQFISSLSNESLKAIIEFPRFMALSILSTASQNCTVNLILTPFLILLIVQPLTCWSFQK